MGWDAERSPSQSMVWYGMVGYRGWDGTPSAHLARATGEMRLRWGIHGLISESPSLMEHLIVLCACTHICVHACAWMCMYAVAHSYARRPPPLQASTCSACKALCMHAYVMTHSYATVTAGWSCTPCPTAGEARRTGTPAAARTDGSPMSEGEGRAWV